VVLLAGDADLAAGGSAGRSRAARRLRGPAARALRPARGALRRPRHHRPRARRRQRHGRGPAAAAPDHARRREGRDPRRPQRHAADQPRARPGRRREAAVRRGLHPVGQLVELPAAQTRRAPPGRRGRPRRGLPLPHRPARGLGAAAALHRRPRAERRGDRRRRRHRARAPRLPPGGDGARLRRLLPQLPRGRAPELGGARRARPRLGARPVGGARGAAAAAAERGRGAGGTIRRERTRPSTSSPWGVRRSTSTPNEIGAAFEDIQGFAAYVGGSPLNIAVGAQRLGLRTRC
jgi:hypothetical protein